MRSFALLVVLAGCSFRLNAAGSGSGTSDAAGDTQVDSSIDGAPGDSDGDGVPDGVDNCPHDANADQRDHDTDGRGDVCDLCPHIAEATDVDGDGDGVGDACDPRPTTPGDRRALWVGFYDANDTTGWLANATYTVALGRLTIGDTNLGLEYAYPNTQFQHVFAQTSVRFDTLGAATINTSPAALFYTGDLGMPQYYLCEPAAAQNGAEIYALDNYPNNQNHFDNQTWTGTLAAGSEIMLTDTVLGNTHTCTAKQGATTVSVTQNAGATQGVVALSVTYASVSYDYLWVVEIGP